MNANPNRRGMVKTLAATAGLVALGSVATAAEPAQTDKLAGEWLMEGRKEEPCGVFQQGRVLLLVNERGELATGQIAEANKFTVKGWDDGLVGEVTEKGKKMAWSNGTAWQRA
jgi:hypothetical protein